MTLILSDKTIKKYIKKYGLVTNNISENSIQPASLDITIGNSFSTIEHNGAIRLDERVNYRTVEKDRFRLLPGQFVLATTQEYVKLPDNITAFVEGRSSIGRIGLFIQNAGWVDPGFEGQITLELFNASQNVIILQKGIRVGQLVFAKMDHAANNPYRGKYQGQKGATGSKLYLDKGK